MFHFQDSVQDWPRAVGRLPVGSLVKAIDRGDILRDVKAINPGIRTALRHYGGPQNIFDGRGLEGYKRLAREFFATFVDETFRAQYARHVDVVLEWNEYLASSHTGQELQDRIDWARAAAWVWRHEYRTQPGYGHIRLGLLSAPVGNDIHRAFAEIALEYDCVLSYHAYDKFLGDHKRDPLSWRYHCGRWDWMEASWGGLKPLWMFGEAGPYAGVLEGWRHGLVLNGDTAAYVEAVRRWIGELRSTAAFREGRLLGFNLFTSGGTNEWKYYETRQPEMEALAVMIGQEWVAPPGPPGPPPPAPVGDGRLDGSEMENLWAFTISEQIRGGISLNPGAKLQGAILADGYTPVLAEGRWLGADGRLWAWQPAERVDGARPRRVYYCEVGPGPSYYDVCWFGADGATGQPGGAEAVWAPVGTLAERMSGKIWPGAWVDANPYGTAYDLRGRLAYHTGADLNLNVPRWNADAGAEVYAVADGDVVYAGRFNESWGNLVVLRHGARGGFYSRYGHLATVTVRKGDVVFLGEQVGTVGGADVGLPDHLHFDISTTDVLERSPGDWPGSDLGRLRRDYVDPALFLKAVVSG